MGKALVIGQASSKVLAPFFGYILLNDLTVRNDAACHKIVYKNRTLIYLYGALKAAITADLTIRLNAIISGTSHEIGVFTIPQSTAVDVVLEWSGSDFSYTNCPHKSTINFDITASDGSQLKDGIAEFLLVLTPSDSGEGAPSSSPGSVTHLTGSLTAGEPVFGSGTGDITIGSRSGDTTEVVTTTGAHVAGDAGVWDASGNWIDSGSPPVSLPIAESDVTGLVADLAAKVPATRTISTTAPLTGGGDLSANRTLAIDAFTGDSGSGGAKGAVPAPGAGDAAAGKVLGAGGAWVTPAASAVHGFSATFDGGGSALTAGMTAYLAPLPSGFALAGWGIVVDTGTATIKVWKVAAGTAKPTAANSINTSGVAISSGTVIESTTLTDFTTTTFVAGDIVAVHLEAVSGATVVVFGGHS